MLMTARVFLAVLLFHLGACVAAAQSTPVDVALVFAFDGSSSISDDEFRMQLRGTAQALQSAAVLRAISSGRHQRVAVAFVVWGDPEAMVHASPWHFVSDATDADAFAWALQTHRRRIFGDTGTGPGLMAAIRHLEDCPCQADRRVVDVSGDGMESPAFSGRKKVKQIYRASHARDHARASHITINALAVIDDETRLVPWLAENVQSGASSFIQVANSWREFETAMMRKLQREIALQLLSGVPTEH